jgi:hypothetical protein
LFTRGLGHGALTRALGQVVHEASRLLPGLQDGIHRGERGCGIGGGNHFDNLKE